MHFILKIMQRFQRVLVMLLLVLLIVPSLLPASVAFAQAGPITVIGRAATRAARIATAEAELAEAVAGATAAAAASIAAQAAIAAGAECLVFAPVCTALLTNQALQVDAELKKAADQIVIAADNLADAQKTIMDDILDMLDKVLLQTLKKRILDMMVDQIIGYIQGEGSPRFVTDWKGFMDDIAQGAVGEFTKELGLGFLCSPFKLQLRLSLLPVERFKVDRFDCTLDQIVGNIQNFYDDFRNGGWVAFDSSLQMNNNFYGAFFLAMDARSNAIAEAVNASGRELEVGAGFLSAKRCVDERGIEIPTAQVESYRAAVQRDRTGQLKLVCDIVTPGRTLGAAVEKAVGSDIDFIVSAQDLSAYVAAIADALINRVIKEGFGLLGVSTPNGPQVGKGFGHSVIAGPESFPSGLRDVNNQSNVSRRDALNFVPPTASPQQIAAASNGREQIRQTLFAHISLQQSLIDALGELEACQLKRSSVGVIGASVTPSAVAQATHATLQTEKATLEQLLKEADANDAQIQRLRDNQNAVPFDALVPTLAARAQKDLQRAQATVPARLIDVKQKTQSCAAGR